jgi:hypothetical protein
MDRNPDEYSMGTGATRWDGDLFKEFECYIRFRLSQIQLANFPRLRS